MSQYPATLAPRREKNSHDGRTDLITPRCLTPQLPGKPMHWDAKISPWADARPPRPACVTSRLSTPSCDRWRLSAAGRYRDIDRTPPSAPLTVPRRPHEQEYGGIWRVTSRDLDDRYC